MRQVTMKIFAVLMASMLVLAGCSGNSNNKAADQSQTSQAGSNASSGQGITLEFQQWWGVELPDGFLQEIVDGFTEQTGIKIELLSNPYADTRNQISAGAATGSMADVVGLDGSWVYDFAKQGSIVNLSALMEARGYDDSQLSDQIKVDGSTYMIPVVNFAYPMYVNLDILEEAGITDIPTNWSEFLAATKQITSTTGKAGWAIPLSTESPSGIQNNFMSWLWASGGSMLTQDGKPNLTNNPDLAATVEFVKDMFDSGIVAPGAYAMREPDMVEEFTNGRVAFMTDSLAHLGTIQNGAPDLNLDFVSIPVKDGYTGKSGMVVSNWGIGIAENSKYKDEAMQFIEYLMSPEVNAKLSVQANAFPGNVHSVPDYPATNELFLKAYDIFKGGYAINEFTGLPISEQLMRQFDEQLQLYLDGDTANVNEMLEKTQALWSEAFE